MSTIPHFESLSEQLTWQFYSWEIHGRGWYLWPYPVALEPPFAPFYHHSVRPLSRIDDGRRPGFLGSLFPSRTSESGETRLIRYDELIAPPVEDYAPVVELVIGLSEGAVTTRERIERFLLSTGPTQDRIGFEIIGTGDEIRFQLVVSEREASNLQSQFRAYFPDLNLEAAEKPLSEIWSDDLIDEAVVVDFGLSEEFMSPLRSADSFDVDPLIAVVAALSQVERDETAMLQVLFQGISRPWGESIERAVTDWDGKPFFFDAPSLHSQARQKVSSPLFAAVIRAAAKAPDRRRARGLVKAIGKSLSQFADPVSNELIPLSNEGYWDELHENALIFRQTHRNGMILNLKELIGLVHPPSKSVQSEKLRRDRRKSRPAPRSLTGHNLVLGENVHGSERRAVSLSPEHRIRHTYLVGASGTGKSTLLLRMILQDLENGQGIGLLDPHGDLVDAVLARVPENRIDDVILIDPSDEEFPVGFNILSAHSELEKNLLASDLVGIFRRLSTSWGDQMTSVLANAVIAFLESKEGGTLADLRRFLVEKDFRTRYLESVEDSEVVYYWSREFPLLTGRPQAPLLTRLDAFLRPKPVRYMVAQRENRVNFSEIMDRGKIFLAKLSHGGIGEENAHLLGALIVAKFHQTAMSRQATEVSARRPFYLYLDEFHHFATPSMAAILAGARKYQLGLTLAHQELRQLADRNPSLASAVTTNPCTRICFRLGDSDARSLQEGFASFDASDLQDLGVGEALCRVERSENDFNLTTQPVPAVDPDEGRRRVDEVIRRSREKYATSRKEVEELLHSYRPSVVEEKSRGETPVPTEEKPKQSQAVEPPRREVENRDSPQLEEEQDNVQQVTRIEPPRTPVERDRPKAPDLPGRGGPEHRYLQQFIRKLAQERGYRATVEYPVDDGAGKIDVLLEKSERRIACEISITSTPDQEIGNLKKCLEAGVERVILLSPTSRTLSKVEELAKSELQAEDLEKISFLEPEAFLLFLDEANAEEAGSEKTVAGYRVKVRHKAVSSEEREHRRKMLAEVMVKAMRRAQKE